jgi:hypothetical protein
MEVIAGDIQTEESEALEHCRHIGKQLELMKSRVRRRLQALWRKHVRV